MMYVGDKKRRKDFFLGLVPTSHIGGRMMKFKSHFNKNKMPTGRQQGQSRRRHSTNASQNARIYCRKVTLVSTSVSYSVHGTTAQLADHPIIVCGSVAARESVIRTTSVFQVAYELGVTHSVHLYLPS